MRLAAIIGHQPAVRLLRRWLSHDRLPQTLLIEGRAGTGRRTLGLAAAQARLCRTRNEGDACGQCESCRLAEAGHHPDLVALDDDRRQTQIDVEWLREHVVQAARESPLLGHGRVFLLPAAERLMANQAKGANALLKVLEEPPAGVHFLLTTEQARALLPTILSRAHILRLAPLDATRVEAILVRSGVDPLIASRRATAAAGSLRGTGGDALTDAPLADLRSLILDGLSTPVVARIIDRLAEIPAHESEESDEDDTAGGRSGRAKTERRILLLWIDRLIQDLRSGLRGDRAPFHAQAIIHVLQLRGDLQRYVPPRLIVEGLGLLGQ